jgi:hypothetical protein
MKNAKINLNKLGTLVIILVIAGFIATSSTTMASNGNQSSQEDQIPTANKNINSTSTPNTNSNSNQDTNATTLPLNISENVKQYNKTNVTPKNQTEQVRAQEQTMFQYRNMTMTMNCTQNCTLTFTADEEITPKLFGLSVDPNQTINLAMNLSKSPINGAMVNERCLNFYLGIEPNVTLELKAQIRLYINQTELSQSMNREINASRLSWMYWNQTTAQWEAVQSYMDQNGYLVCNTDHFSTWTIAEIEQAAEEKTTTYTQNNALPIEYITIGTVAAVGFIALGLVAYKKRK